MSGTDSVSIFTEGTFEEQVRSLAPSTAFLNCELFKIQELVDYVVRNRTEDERTSAIRSFQGALKSKDGNPLEEDKEKRKFIFSKVLAEVKGLGDGSEKGNFRHSNL